MITSIFANFTNTHKTRFTKRGIANRTLTRVVPVKADSGKFSETNKPLANDFVIPVVHYLIPFRAFF
jgi:hypothetical protein